MHESKLFTLILHTPSTFFGHYWSFRKGQYLSMLQLSTHSGIIGSLHLLIYHVFMVCSYFLQCYFCHCSLCFHIHVNNPSTSLTHQFLSLLSSNDLSLVFLQSLNNMIILQILAISLIKNLSNLTFKQLMCLIRPPSFISFSGEPLQYTDLTLRLHCLFVIYNPSVFHLFPSFPFLSKANLMICYYKLYLAYTLNFFLFSHFVIITQGGQPWIPIFHLLYICIPASLSQLEKKTPLSTLQQL